MLHEIVSVSVVNMVTVCALYAHVIAFAAACAEVGAQEARKTQHKATHRKEEKPNILSFLPLLLLFEDGETAEEKADAFFAFFSKSLVVIFADDENVSLLLLVLFVILTVCPLIHNNG